MAFSATAQAAIGRLAAYYNGNPISTGNPGGLDNNGHRTNFVPILRDTAEAAGAVGEAINLLEGITSIVTAEVAINSAATTDLGSTASPRVGINGVTTITSFGTGVNLRRELRFIGALTLTHNATSLILPGGANIVTAAGDTAVAISNSFGNWRVVRYQRASGKSVIGPAAADVSDSTSVGRAVLTAATAGAGAASLGLGASSAPTFGNVTVSASFGSLSLVDTGSPVNKKLTRLLAGFGQLAIYRYNDDGTTVRTIPLLIDENDQVSVNTIFPSADGSYNLGKADKRFSNSYFTVAPTVGSDRRLKADISAIPEAWLDAWGEVEWVRFKLKASVAEKGDAARWHTGLIYQDVVAAFERHAVDAYAIGLVCFDRWAAEPGREAQAEVPPTVDEDGHMIDPGRPALPAVAATPAGESGSVRYEEAQAIEAAWQRREIGRQAARIAALEAV